MTKIEEQVGRRIELLNNYCNKYCMADKGEVKDKQIINTMQEIYIARALDNADEIVAKGNELQSRLGKDFIDNCSKVNCSEAKDCIVGLIAEQKHKLV